MARTKKPTLTFASSVKKPTLTFASSVKKPTVTKSNSKGRRLKSSTYYHHHYGSKRYLNGKLEGQITKDGKFKIKYDNGKVKRFRITKRGAVLVKSTKKKQNGKYNYYYCTNRRDCKLAKKIYDDNVKKSKPSKDCPSRGRKPVKCKGSTAKERRSHRRKQLLLFHPDKNKGCVADATRKTKQIMELCP